MSANSVEGLVDDLLAAHEATRLKQSLYLAAATALHFCEGWGWPPKCRVCGRAM